MPVKAKQYFIDKNPFISKILDVSTAHITRQDDVLLDDTDGANPITAYFSDPGYLVCIPGEIDPDRRATALEIKKGTASWRRAAQSYGYSREIIKLILKAAQLHCTYIRLDPDGIEYEDLKTFVW